jgi:subtilisin family serine protease
LCTAADNAAALGAFVVAAAGNEHSRAEALRRFGATDSFDTEMTCPGQARNVISVAALTKLNHTPAEFSSRGPTSYGLAKPVCSAPGVNVISTAPAPRSPAGKVLADAARVDLFTRDSGTSIATPIVAGALALVMQDHRERGLSVTLKAMMEAVEAGAVTAIGLPFNAVGHGRIDMTSFGAA